MLYVSCTIRLDDGRFITLFPDLPDFYLLTPGCNESLWHAARDEIDDYVREKKLTSPPKRIKFSEAEENPRYFNAKIRFVYLDIQGAIDRMNAN